MKSIARNKKEWKEKVSEKRESLKAMVETAEANSIDTKAEIIQV